MSRFFNRGANQDMDSLAGTSNKSNEGWGRVRKNVPRIVDYGRREGILPPLAEKLRRIKWMEGEAGALGGLVRVVEEEEMKKEEKKLTQDVIKIQANDISLIHEAIPFLPVPVAVLCFLLNLVGPGSGTMLSGVAALCMGQPRLNMKDGRRFVSFIVNILVGIAQFGTVTFFLVGWFWSIAWGGLLFTHSLQYREALLERRQEAVATAAIEALTKDSILHRRDVKQLVSKERNTKKSDKKDKK